MRKAGNRFQARLEEEMKPNHFTQAFFLFLFSLSLCEISTQVMNNNNNNPSDSSKENSFQGLWPPPTATLNNVAAGDNETRSPPINVPGDDNETRPRLPPNNVPGANEIRPHPPPMLNVRGANETHEKPKKKKKRTREIIVGGDPIMTTLRLGGDPNMRFVVGSTSKPKSVGKKPIDPNAPKITCPCAECGKSFWSWKALFGHMRCHPDRTWRGIIPPANRQQRNDGASTSANPPPRGSGSGRVNMNEEDQEVATGLLMLANGLFSMGGGQILNDPYQGSPEPVDSAAVEANENHGYECSSCKRVFGSHQALGGHRASHKKVKGCFAIAAENSDESTNENHRNNEDDNSNGTGSNDRGKGKGKAKVTDEQGIVLGHRCGVCSKIFASGQALGGHMRCHWERGENSSSSSMMLQPQQLQGAGIFFNPSTTTAGCSTSYATTRGERNGSTTGYALDLNLPPPHVPDEPEPEPEPEATVPPAPVDAANDHDGDSSSSSSSEMDLDLKLGF